MGERYFRNDRKGIKMQLDEALDILKEAKIKVESKNALDFNYKLTDKYVIFPTVEDVVKCFGEDLNKGYTYISGNSYHYGCIGYDEDYNESLIVVYKKTKEGYWTRRDDFYDDSSYKINERQDILLNVTLPVINQTGKSLSFEDFLKKRTDIIMKRKAYDDYCKELRALSGYVKKRMTEMAKIFKINMW